MLGWWKEVEKLSLLLIYLDVFVDLPGRVAALI